MLLLAAAAALTALAILHTLFWGWVYRVRPAQDELRFVETKDGWRLAVARRAPRGEPRLPPVLLCHGLSANRGNLDFGIERWSLSLALAQAGFDCFALDLRGHGGSRRVRPGVPRRWSFDTYLEQDIPAVLDDVRSATGSDRVLWVGHTVGVDFVGYRLGELPLQLRQWVDDEKTGVDGVHQSVVEDSSLPADG